MVLCYNFICMIEFKNVSKTYKNGTHALYDVNLIVEDGEFAYIIGPTGSGKSTLIKLLDGEEIPTNGHVLVSGVDVGRLKKSKVYLYRRKIGVVFQNYRLLPDKTVFENVAFALEILDVPTDKIRKRVREVLKLVDLADKANSRPDELSGGQQQRVAIARAIVKKPTLLIADEPTGNLDPGMTDEIVSILEKINKEEKTTILVVTHDNVMVKKHPKRIITIESGHITHDHPLEINNEEFMQTLNSLPVDDHENHSHLTDEEIELTQVVEAEEALKDLEGNDNEDAI